MPLRRHHTIGLSGDRRYGRRRAERRAQGLRPAAGGARLEVLEHRGRGAWPPGSWTALTGRSGSGKTTLLNLVAGISRRRPETITVGGADVVAMTEAQRDAFRASRRLRLPDVQSPGRLQRAGERHAGDDVLPMRCRGVSTAGARRRSCRAWGWARGSLHPPHRLSRGEQQRVAIARALANDPPLILADEPCASLDAHTAREVLTEFWSVCQQDGEDRARRLPRRRRAGRRASRPRHVRDQPRRWPAPAA